MLKLALFLLVALAIVPEFTFAQDDTTANNSNGLSKAEIGGIVAGVVIFVLTLIGSLVCCLVWCFCCQGSRMMGGGPMDSGYGPGHMGGGARGGGYGRNAIYPPIIQRVEPVIQQHRVIEHVRAPPAIAAPPPTTVIREAPPTTRVIREVREPSTVIREVREPTTVIRSVSGRSTPAMRPYVSRYPVYEASYGRGSETSRISRREYTDY